MLRLLHSPWSDAFATLVGEAKASLLLCSPYIGEEPCSLIRHRARGWSESFGLTILTDLSRDNMLSGATDVAAILRVAEAFPPAQIKFLPSLHAKVYVADSARAVVTSANMTAGGLLRNFEYGVLLLDGALASRVQRDISDYAGLASSVALPQLQRLSKIVEGLRVLRRESERRWRTALRREFDRQLAEADRAILRVRAAGRSPHSIFADAILYHLRRRPATTEELHAWVRAVHPDLCDDMVERVIEGKRFGKKWKHAVRTAQQYLKRQGLVELHDGRWRLCQPGSST